MRPLTSRALRTALGAVACTALLAACATSDFRPTALEDARLAVTAARDNPTVADHAPDELSAAVTAFRRAEDRFHAEGDSNEVRHLGYVAQRRAEIAVQAANQRASEQEIVAARAEEERVRSLARERAAQPAPPR